MYQSGYFYVGPDTWSGNYSNPVTPGSPGSASDSQCTLNGVGSSVKVSGDNLLITVNLTFASGFIGPQQSWMMAVDAAGGPSQWQQVGNWTPTQAPYPSALPQAVSVTPPPGQGMSGTFVFLARDQNGEAYMPWAELVFGPVSGPNCSVVVYHSAGGAYLISDSGPWVQVTPAGVSNNQCTVFPPTSSPSGEAWNGAGNDWTISIPVTFNASFAGSQPIYLWVYDHALQASGFVPLGSWTVGVPSVTQTVTSTPVGLSLTVDGAACTSPCTPQWVPGSIHTIAAATQSGGAGMQYVFGNWSDAGAASHTVTAPSTAATYTAAFTVQYYLTTSAGTGGSISPSSGWYNAGTVVPVGASPGPGYQFAGFSGALGGTSTPQNLTISVPSAVAASFLVLPPSLTITSTHPADFTQGQSNATYTLTVTNGASAGPTGGTVTVADAIPSGLIPVSMSGSGWTTCTATSCSRTDALATGASYPPITVTVNVAGNAPASVTNSATVSGGGSASASDPDPTTIDAVPHYSNPLAFAVPATVAGGVPTTFSVTYASSAGAADNASGQVQIDGCYLEWDSSGNISLATAHGVLGQQATLKNTNCAINLASSSFAPVANNPKAMRLSLNLTFSEQNFVGTHEVYAWGTNAAGLTTAQTDLGPMVVSQGPDFILNVTPSGIINVPYMGTATMNVTATALNGFNDEIDLQLSLTPGYSNPCFGQIGNLAGLTPNTQGTFIFQNDCPGSSPYPVQYQITGTATSIGVSHTAYNGPTLTPSPGSGFAVTVGLPSASALPVQGSVTYPLTVTSIGGLGGTVNFSLAPPQGSSMPAGVTSQFSSPAYLPGGGTATSTLTLTGSASTPGGTFPLVVTGTLPGTVNQTANFSLGTQVTAFQVTSATGSAIVHNTGQEVQVTHNVPAGSVPSNSTCETADPDVTCRVISSSSGTAILGITGGRGAVHGTHVLILDGGATTVHAAMADIGGFGLPQVELDAGASTSRDVDLPEFPCYIEGSCGYATATGPDWVTGFGVPGLMTVYFDPPLSTPPGSYPYGVDLCSGFFDPDEEDACVSESGTVIVDAAAAPPAPTTTILFNGTDVTNKTTNVIVGQQIALTASISGGVSISQQNWAIGGTYVGGFTNASGTCPTNPPAPTASTGTTCSPATTGANVTYYFTDSGNNVTASYFAVGSDGTNYSAQTSFNIVKPLADTSFSADAKPIVINALDQTGYATDTAPGYMALRYGLGSSSIPSGITFLPNYLTPDGYSGTIQWVQVLNTNTVVRTPAGSSHPGTLNCMGELDGPYPLGTSKRGERLPKPRTLGRISGVQSQLELYDVPDVQAQSAKFNLRPNRRRCLDLGGGRVFG